MPRGVPARKEVSEQELIFCSEYLKAGDSAAAARAAFPSHKYPAKYGRKLLARPHVIRHLATSREKLVAKYDASHERIIQETAAIAFGTLHKFIKINADGEPFWDFSDSTPDERAAIGELSVDVYKDGRGPSAQLIKKFKISERDRLAALRLLAQMTGLLSDQAQNKIKVEISLVDRINRGRAALASQIDKKGAIDAKTI